MTEETTTDQLADTSGRDIVQGLVLQVADLIQREEAEIERQPEAKPQPQPEEQPQPQPVQVRDGRWRTRGGEIRNVTPTPEGDGRENRFPWWDAQYRQTWTLDGRYHFGGASALDLVEYLRPIEEQPQPEPQPQPESDAELQAQVAFLKGREVTLGTRLQQEKQVTTRLREELATQAETIRRLRIELDAAQQVPADSPELRQLRADLAEVTQDRDTYRHAHELLLNDVNATHARTKAMTVEAIAEWLEPIRLVDSAYLANATMQHLPQIMRHLTGLDSHAID